MISLHKIALAYVCCSVWVLTGWGQTNAVWENKTFLPSIKTVLLYPYNGTPNAQAMLNPPILQIQESAVLHLAFDCLDLSQQGFRIKIYHCNADWTRSDLNEIEYLSEYNDVPIYDYQNAFATKIPYHHFSIDLPKVKMSGNYVVVVYRNRNEQDIVLSQRFMVFQSSVAIAANVRFANQTQQRNTHQALQFSLSYTGYEILDPKTDLQLVVRQNFQTMNHPPLQPFMIDNFNQKISYQFFNGENVFAGGNEYRLFDARSTQQKLVNIAGLHQEDRETALDLYLDAPQEGLPYVDTKDFDGMYAIDHYETNQGNTNADYVQVHFRLKTEPSETPIYVVGAFNQWQCNSQSQLQYNELKHWYECTLQLKQGIYNYQYITEMVGKKRINLDGNHAQTQNTYEIFVYHRPVGGRADALVGYVRINSR